MTFTFACARCGASVTRKHIKRSAKHWYCSATCSNRAKQLPIEERMRAATVVLESGCHEWRGGIDKDGYGVITWNGRQHKAHRVAYTLAHGSAPSEPMVCHHCDNPRCVNPKHLFVGNALDNNRDMLAKNRQRYLCGEEHPNAKLTIATVRQIRALRTHGFTQRSIGEACGCSQTAVWSVLHGELWGHVE